MEPHGGNLMALLPDPFGLFTDDGGGPSGDSSFDEFLDFLKKQQSNLKELTEREREQAESFAGLRRGALADRTGFAGLVTVGAAERRTDLTLAAEIGLLAEDDPQRQAFQEALTAESQQRAKQTRVITGEQFRAEDALAALRERLEDVSIGTAGFAAAETELGEIKAEFGEFGEEFEFFTEDGDFLSDVQSRLDELTSQEEARQRRLRRRLRERDQEAEGSDSSSGGGGPGAGESGTGTSQEGFTL